jgi:hypothetical protein
MAHSADPDALVTLAAIALCGAIVVPLLALSTVDGLLVVSAWVVSLALSYGLAVAVAHRPRRDPTDRPQ